MPAIEIHSPLKLRLTGTPSEDQWQELEDALVRRYARAFRLAARSAQAGLPARAAATAAEPGAYAVPSYQDAGAPTLLPLISADTARLRLSPDPFHESQYEHRGWWLVASDFRTLPTLTQIRRAIVGWDGVTEALLARCSATFVQRPSPRYSYWSFRHPDLGVVARAYGHRSGGPAPDFAEFGVYMFVTHAEARARIYGARGSEQRDAPAGIGGRGLTPEQAQLVELYRQRFPISVRESGGALPLDLSQKIRLALELSDKTLLGEIAEAASRAIRDPVFVVSTVAIIGFYVFLWLTPDPTLVTKAIAAALTIYLLYHFTINDIIGFARAWLDLSSACSAARTEDALRRAGDAFLAAVGPIGFDIILLIVFWGAARTVAPRVRAGATRRAVARAEAEASAAEQAPGSGINPRALDTPSRLVYEARAAAADPANATSVLDALAQRLPEAARRGLEAQRARLRRGRRGAEVDPADADARLLGILEAMQIDPIRQLIQWGQTPPEVAAAELRLIEARARLARLRIIEAGVAQEPSVRGRVRREAARETPALERARAAVRELVAALQGVSPEVRAAFERANVESIVSAIAEALARADLRGLYEALRLPGGVRIFSNLRIAQRVPGYTSIEAWVRDNPGADATNLAHFRGELYRVLGEVDNLVAGRGPGGRFRVLELEETKTGAEPLATAVEQVGRARQIFEEIGRGAGLRSNARVFEGGTFRQLGNDVTNVFDLTDLSALVESTRGPLGRPGFTRSLPFDHNTLVRVVSEMLSTRPGLPAQPQTVLPPTSPRAPGEGPARGMHEDLPGGVPDPPPPPRELPGVPDAGSEVLPGGVLGPVDPFPEETEAGD